MSRVGLPETERPWKPVRAMLALSDFFAALPGTNMAPWLRLFAGKMASPISPCRVREFGEFAIVYFRVFHGEASFWLTFWVRVEVLNW